MDGNMLPDELTDISDQLEQDDRPNRRLGIGEYTIASPPTKITFHGLGSCIAVLLYDPSSGLGAGVHTLLPRRSDYPQQEDGDLTRFTDHGTKTLYKEFASHPEVNEENIEAKIIGGSEVLRFVTFATNVGKRNIKVARETLDELGVSVVAEDVGGEHGRIVEFDLSTGGVIVRSANGDQQVI